MFSRVDNSVSRYSEIFTFVSALDALQDMLNLINACTSLDYLIDVLVSKHNMSKVDAGDRAKKIIPHVRYALDYLHHSLSIRDDVSLLPLYYGVLNLIKTYILIGPYHAEIFKQRLHGATHNIEGNCQDIFSDKVIIKPKGTIPLLYKTITGLSIEKDVSIKIGDVYSVVYDVCAEYRIITGEAEKIAMFSIDRQAIDGQECPTVKFDPEVKEIDLVKLLTGAWQIHASGNYFLGPPRPKSANGEDDMNLHTTNSIRRYMIVNDISGANNSTPILSHDLHFFEEFAIAIIFYHLSSVVRYAPDFMERIKASKYWPLIGAARRHLLFKMLVLFWSFVHKTQLTITR